MAKAQTDIGASRFAKLDAARQAHLERARICSTLTLPSLLPPEGSDENTPLPTPWQSMGARCTNNLASKIILTLMPPNNACFRFVLDEATKRQLEAQMGSAGFRSQVEEQLSLREIQIQNWMEKSKIRVPSYRIMRLLIVTGNALMYRHPSRTLKVYRLDQYVVRRNGVGEPVEIVVKDMIDPVDLPKSLQSDKNLDENTGTQAEMVSAYTYCILKKDVWHVHQEVNGKLIPNTRSKFTPEKFPFRPLVWSRADGENYGRGQVEEYLGDLNSLEELSKAIVETTAAGAKLLFLRNPNGVTRKKDLIEAPNGGFVDGQAEDVVPLRVEKMNDLMVAKEKANEIEDSLSRAFLLHTSIQRNAERVTAEEIRFMAQDIEDALGGIYSILAQEYQLPLVEWAIQTMEEDGQMEELPEEITVTITTGLEALGRGHDLTKLGTFMQQITALGAEAVSQYLIVQEYIRRVATALGINVTGLIKTEDQIAQERQQAQQAAQNQQQQEMMMNSPVAAEIAKNLAGDPGAVQKLAQQVQR